MSRDLLADVEPGDILYFVYGDEHEDDRTESGPWEVERMYDGRDGSTNAVLTHDRDKRLLSVGSQPLARKYDGFGEGRVLGFLKDVRTE